MHLKVFIISLQWTTLQIKRKAICLSKLLFVVVIRSAFHWNTWLLKRSRMVSYCTEKNSVLCASHNADKLHKENSTQVGEATSSLNLAASSVELSDKSRLIQTLSFTLPHLIFLTHTLYHNAIFTCTHLLLHTDKHHPAIWSTTRCKIIKWAALFPISAVKQDSQGQKYK